VNIERNNPNVRCHAVVDLLGRAPQSFYKPNYRFLVTVWGEPPHAVVRKYEIVAYGEDTAAHLGLREFEREMSLPAQIAAVLSSARLQ
jgi:hypothetical protein